MDYLQVMFPAKAFQNWMEHTNEHLIAKWSPTMATRFGSSFYQSLWSSIWKTSLNTWSFQPEERPPCVSSEDYWWILVDNFVALFNKHTEKFFNLSLDMCANKSMSHWYAWQQLDLYRIVYVCSIGQEARTRMQDSDLCDGQCWIMLRLLSVKLQNIFSVKVAIQQLQKTIMKEFLNHEMQVLKYLIQLWARPNCVVYADSCFHLFRVHERFIARDWDSLKL